MKLPPIKKILREDVKSAPSWISGIIDPVNSFMEAVYQSLNKNITLTENIASFVKEIIYTTPSTYPSGVEQVIFMNQLRAKPTGLMVMQAYERSSYIPATGPVYVPWVEDDGDIILSTVTGLAANKTYVLRLVIF